MEQSERASKQRSHNSGAATLPRLRRHSPAPHAASLHHIAPHRTALYAAHRHTKHTAQQHSRVRDGDALALHDVDAVR